MKLPDKLNRKAIIIIFTRISEGRWLYIFRHEKENGFFAYRVRGPYKRAYYSSEKVTEWLLMEGFYRPEDFEPPQAVKSAASGWFGAVPTTRHVLAA